LVGDDPAVIPFPLPTEPEVSPSSAGPAIDWSSSPDIGADSVPATRPAPPSDAAGHDDEETAARRAIEGNWTPKGSAAARPVEMPELSAEDAMLASRNAIRAASAAAMALLHHAPESVEPGSQLPSEDDEDEEPVRKAAQ
jgi:hypothetical protein